MRVRLTQIIDFWVGVPLCFFFSLWRRLLTPLGRRASGQPAKLLFIELSEMGSAIIGYSALQRTRELYAGADLYFLTFAKNAESVELLRIIAPQNILKIEDDSFLKFAFSTLKALRRIRRIGIDTTIDMELFSRATAIISFLSGARRRVGFHNFTAEGLYRGNLLTHRVFYNPHQHMSLNFLALVYSLAGKEGEVPALKQNLREKYLPLPRHLVPRREREEMFIRLTSCCSRIEPDTHLILFNPDPGEALPIRGWPVDRFGEVAQALLNDYPQAFVILIGLTRARACARAIIEQVASPRCIDFTGRTDNLRELLALCSLAKLLITNDSGPAHIAALTDIHSIVLFGPETPDLYGPLSERSRSMYSHFSCSPCLSAANHRHTLCRDNLCLKAINTESVIAESRLILNRFLPSPEKQKGKAAGVA